MRPTATVSRACWRSWSAAFELEVLLEDRFRLDHPLEHRVVLALEIAILANRIPIVAGAGDQAFSGGGDLVEGAGDGPGDVERGSAQLIERLRARPARRRAGSGRR